MKYKKSSSKKVFWPYKNSTNHFSNLTNRVSRNVISNLSIAVDFSWVNNIPSISTSRAMQEPTIPSTSTELPASSQYSSNVQTTEDNIFISHDQDMDITNT